MALRSPPADDLIYESLSHADTVEIPNELDLTHLIKTPIRNQHARGTCAAIAAAVIREVQYHRQNGKPSHDLSPEFVYYHRSNSPLPGMYGRNVFEILEQLGTSHEEDMPYRDENDGPKPSKRAYRHANKYKIKNYARIETPDGLKRALFMIGPCFIVLPKYHDGKRFWKKHRGNSLRDSTAVGHAVAVLGYNKKGFILLNSWGADWNGNGLTLLPYRHWNRVWETWVAYTVPDKPKKSLMGRIFNKKKN